VASDPYRIIRRTQRRDSGDRVQAIEEVIVKLYRINCKPSGETKWVASKSDAAGARKAYVDAGYKRAELETEVVDVPTKKDGLVEFLNTFAVRAC
jgi:hypothetical protein